MNLKILILNYNSFLDSIACLESLSKSDFRNFEIVLVDNNSSDNSISNILSWVNNVNISYKYYYKESFKEKSNDNTNNKLFDYPITIIQTGDNLGFAGGNNIGLKHIIKDNTYNAVWLLNPDTEVMPNTLTLLLNYANKVEKNVGVIGTALLYHHSPEILQGLGSKFNPYLGVGKHILGHKKYNNETLNEFNLSDVDMIIGASMFIKREVIEKVGLLEEKYFLYYEEIDYALRVKKMGYSLGLEPKAIVLHKEGACINKNLKKNEVSDFSDFYAMRNRLLLTSKFFPQYIVSVTTGLLFSSLLRLSRGQYKKSWMIIKIILGKRNFTNN